MSRTLIEAIVWFGGGVCVVCGLWAAAFMREAGQRAHRLAIIRGSMTMVAIALFLLFKPNLSDLAVYGFVVMLAIWIPLLLLLNRRTKETIGHVAR